MNIVETALPGVYRVQIIPIEDDRGFFARTFCHEEFAQHGLNPGVAQCSVSFNIRPGTLRGMHYQVAPRAESKLVRCTRGALYDVVVDLRPESATYCQWIGSELTETNRYALYIPEGIAHGFQTLVADTEVYYQISEFYAPECARGVRWNDPAFGIRWPLPDPSLSPRDRSYPDFHR